MLGAGKALGTSGFLSRELIDKPVRGEVGQIPWGEESVSWLWMEDAARAVLLAATAPATRTRNFNLSGDLRPMKDAATIVMDLLPGARIELGSERRGMEHRMDSHVAAEELGFTSEWKLEAQFAELVRRAKTVSYSPSQD
jgi:nucleoside-diphosphate-sugar epimerase